eukprot:GHUV01034705.1.p1 GENE.GHUV01034705.1~~GHUV01034705.1.p1  ORF type:complete len:105 (-),score=9.54 GHUV01034705.1:536-850(-)
MHAVMLRHKDHFTMLLLHLQKCGTTSMAGYLKAHPGISGLAGMPGSEIFGKESHFFGGMLGRNSTTSALLYRSFFPTLITRYARSPPPRRIENCLHLHHQVTHA